MWVAPIERAHVQLAIVDVDADDRARAGEPGTGDRRVTDAAATEHGDRVAAGHRAGVDCGADPRHHATTEQTGRGRLRARVDLRALTGVHQRLLDERADAERGRERRAVGQRHLLRGVVGVEAVPGTAPPTGPAGATHSTPVQDHEVTGHDAADVVTDRLDDPGGLMAEQEREVVVDAAFAIVQVGVADAARQHL